MARTLNGILICALVFALVWAGTVLYWYANDSSPGFWQATLWLLVVPLGLLAVIWGLFLRRRGRLEAPAKEEGEETKGTDLPAVPALRLDIPAVALRLPIGDTPEDVLPRAISPPAAALHPYLRDGAGLPLFSASVGSLDEHMLEGIASELARLAGRRVLVSSGIGRALALLLPVFDELLATLMSVLPVAASADGRVIAGLRHRSVVQRAPAVSVTFWLQENCPQEILALYETLMRERVAEHPDLPELNWHFQGIAGNAKQDLWGLLSRVAGERNGEQPWRLLLAADSQLDEQRLQSLLGQGELMTSRNSQGCLPGEGAAGVLIRPDTDGAGTVYCLGPARIPVEQVRSGGARARLIRDMVHRYNDAVGKPPALVISDADHRVGKTEEAVLVGLELDPEMETAKQVVALGRSGDLGVAGPLVMLILAWQALRSDNEPVLLLTLQGEGERVVAALSFTSPEQNQSESRIAAAVESE